MSLIPVTIFGNSFTAAEVTFLTGFADLTHTQGDIWYASATGQVARLAAGNSGQVLATQGAGANPHWIDVAGTGTVTTVSVVSANGFAGSVANATTTPAITLTTSVTGLIKGNGTAMSAATAGTDYAVGSTGLSGGQTIAGSTLTTENLTLRANAADLTTGQVNITSSKEATNTTTASVALSGGLAVAKRVYALDMTVTNTIVGSVNGNAATVTNATLTTALTVNTGTLTLTANAANTSVLTIGAGAVSVSGSNTGDQTTVSGNAGTATALQNVRTIWGQNFDGTGNVTGSLTAVANITGGASSMTITAGTGASRTLALQSTTSGSTATTFLTGNADQTTTFAAGILGTGAWTITGGAGNMTILSGTGASRTMIFQTTTSGSTATTALTLNADQTATFAAGATLAGATTIGTGNAFTCGTIELGAASDTTIARVSAGVISVEGATVGMLSTAQTWTAQNKFNNIVDVNNAIAASGNAATVPVTFRLNTVTNNSAATLTITMTTASAVDGQMTVVRILDSSAAAQTITWVNTEDSTVTAPTTSNGSTTLFLTAGFIYNGGTSKWRCIAKA